METHPDWPADGQTCWKPEVTIVIGCFLAPRGSLHPDRDLSSQMLFALGSYDDCLNQITLCSAPNSGRCAAVKAKSRSHEYGLLQSVAARFGQAHNRSKASSSAGRPPSRINTRVKSVDRRNVWPNEESCDEFLSAHACSETILRRYAPGVSPQTLLNTAPSRSL